MLAGRDSALSAHPSLGGHLASRIFESQVMEVHTRVAALNVMTYLGAPASVWVGAALS